MVVNQTKKKRVYRLNENKRKHRKTCFHRKNRKLQRFFSILKKKRQDAYKQSQSIMLGGGLFSKAENAKVKNKEQEKKLQGDENFGKNTTDQQQSTDQQQLLAHKDLKSAFEESEEAKLTKEMKYQRKYSDRTTAMEATASAGLAFAVANATVGLLAATGVGLPAAGGIAVCLIIISKIMKKIKESYELQIVMLDMNTILTNCYYLENMMNKVLTIFQIYINDTTPDKQFFKKIITVDEYTNLNNSCKNIKQLVDENKKTTNTTNIDDFIIVASPGTTTPTTTTINTTTIINTPTPTNKKPKYSDFINKTKVLKGYNLGERIQNAKQLYIDNGNDINNVIQAEKTEYETFGTALALDKPDICINIDDDDALESLMKYMVYKRIEKGLERCSGDNKNEKASSSSKNYEKNSKHIYQIGVNPDIKFRIKQKLNIIRDLLIEIDPDAGQDTMENVELNESLDKVEENAFNALKKTNKKYLEYLNNYTIILNNYTIIKNSFTKDKFKIFIDEYKTKENQIENKIKSETDLNTKLEEYSAKDNVTDENTKDIIMKILNYWLQMKQYYNNINKVREYEYLESHNQEWTQFLKKCFLKIEFYRTRKEFIINNKNKKITEDKMKPYANYENWVRNYYTENKKSRWWVMSTISKAKNKTINFATAKNKTTILMNTMNLLNAFFIIINSQFETVIKEYARALATDTYEDNGIQVQGFNRIWDLCQSTVAYQKFILPPDFSKDKEAILDQIEVSDLITSEPITPEEPIVSDQQQNNQI